MEDNNLGKVIKRLREEKNITQNELAKNLNVSNKAISKWETGRGFPDISLITPLANNLNVSIDELLSGEVIRNSNRSFNMRKLKIYVCPICRNVTISLGDEKINCCGISLSPLEIEENDNNHEIEIDIVEDEYYVNIKHEMAKNHYISFILALKDNSYEFVKLYPEGSADARFKISRTREIYFYCNIHGLYKVIPKRAK